MNYPAFFDVKNSLKLFGFKQEFDFLIKLYYEKQDDYQILNFIFPLLLTSFFDSSMESVRFPFITYTFIGFFIGYQKEKL